MLFKEEFELVMCVRERLAHITERVSKERERERGSG